MSRTQNLGQNKPIKVRFKLLGTPPDRAYKWMEVDPNQIVSEIKNQLRKEYKLVPILDINFILKRKVLSNFTKFGKINYNPLRDVISVMIILAGGAGKKNINDEPVEKENLPEMQERINHLQAKVRKLEFLLNKKEEERVKRNDIEWDREEDCDCGSNDNHSEFNSKGSLNIDRIFSKDSKNNYRKKIEENASKSNSNKSNNLGKQIRISLVFNNDKILAGFSKHEAIRKEIIWDSNNLKRINLIEDTDTITLVSDDFYLLISIVMAIFDKIISINDNSDDSKEFFT